MKPKEMKDKVVAHVKDHMETYIAIGVTGVVVGSISVAGTRIHDGPAEVQALQKIIGPSWKPVQTIIQFVERSTPSKPVYLEGTQQYFDSISDAARKTGHSLSMISRNVNGIIPDVKGDVFKLAMPTA